MKKACQTLPSTLLTRFIPAAVVRLLSRRLVHNRFSEMLAESDPNVIYGGDPEADSEAATVRYASVGDMIVTDLKLGGNKTSFVSGFEVSERSKFI